MSASAQNRPLVLAYNNVACSGDDAAFQLGQYRFSIGKDGSVDLGFEVLVAGTSATDLQGKLAAFDAIRGEDGPLVVQLGRELEVDALVADGTTTVTSAAGGFLATHEGLWLSIRGVGTRRIVTRNSATSVTLDATVTAGSYRAFLPAKLFAGTHAANTFFGGRCSTEKPQGRPENNEFAQVVTVSVSGSTAAKAPLRAASISVTWDASRRRTATLSGTYGPYDYDSDGTVESAKDNHDYFVGTFVTNHLSAFGGASAYELINETQSYDAPEDAGNFASGAIPAKGYSFRRTYQERFVADATGVIDQRCPVVVTANTAHGLPGQVGKVTAQVHYQAAIDHDIVTATGLYAYYVATIRPLIIAAIKLHASTSVVVIESEVPTIDQSANAISASWSVYLPRRSSIILSYVKTDSTSGDPLGITLTREWSGEDYDYEHSPTGKSKARTVNLRVTSQRPIRFSESGEVELLDASSSPVGVVVHGGGGDGGVAGSSSAYDLKGAAGAPAFAAPGGAAAEPAWEQNGGEEGSSDETYLGTSAHGGGTSTATIYSASLTRRYVWVRPGAPVVPAFEGLTATGPVISGAGESLA